MQLDNALIERLRTPMWQVWNSIGWDIIECMKQCRQTLTNEQAIESCIDANNLWLNGNDREADELVLAVCKEHGYIETLKFLCQHFKYV